MAKQVVGLPYEVNEFAAVLVLAGRGAGDALYGWKSAPGGVLAAPKNLGELGDGGSKTKAGGGGGEAIGACLVHLEPMEA